MLAGLLSFRALIPVALVVAMFSGGWVTRGWYADSQAQAERDAVARAIEAQQARESSIAQQVEQRLAAQKTTERVIDRGVIREIQKPIYQRVCAEPAAVRLLNAAAAGRNPDTADTAGDLPADAAAGE